MFEMVECIWVGEYCVEEKTKRCWYLDWTSSLDIYSTNLHLQYCSSNKLSYGVCSKGVDDIKLWRLLNLGYRRKVELRGGYFPVYRFKMSIKGITYPITSFRSIQIIFPPT